MTEREHCPPEKSVFWLSRNRMLIKMPGTEYVISKDEARKLADAIYVTLNTPEPTE